LTGEVSDSSGDPLATYTWLADGTKVGVIDGDGHGLEYTGSLIYKRNGTTLELESTSFGGGRIEVSEGTSGNIYTPNYFLTDHLGSTRAVVTPNGTVRERNDYHPFGLRWSNSGTQISDNRFRFSGKENQTTGNLPYQDFGARFFGGKLPIFITPDPLSNVRPWESTYVYCGNNPVVRTDTDGRIWDVLWDLGNVVYDVGAAVVNHIKGYHDKAKSHWADAGLDVGAAFIPFVPAGASKVVKGIDIIADGAKTVDKVTDAGKVAKNSSDATKNRVKLQRNTKETVKNNAPKTADGQYIDPNTGTLIEKGQEVFGHKTGQEWRKYKADPNNQGKTRKEVIQDQNDPDIYQIEDKKSNASHKYEQR
jgi:RHS repeat-associated protein